MTGVWMMNCRRVEFSPEKSEERINSALRVLPHKVLMRVLAFALHLQGASRKVVAEFVGMPEQSVKTVVRRVLRDGFPALRDRRCSDQPSVVVIRPEQLQLSVRREGEWCVVAFGSSDKVLKLPITHSVQLRTVVLSLFTAELLSAPQTASALGLSAAHCGELARKLAKDDVAVALVDKRQGQKSNYRVGRQAMAEIIQQIAARVITGHSTSSEVLAELVNDKTQAELSARTIRWHVNNLGLADIRKTLPALVEA